MDPLQWTQEYLLQEMNSTLDHNRKLIDKVHKLETEMTVLGSPKSEKNQQTPSSKKSTPSTPQKASDSSTNTSPASAGRGKGRGSKRGGGRGRSRKDSSQNSQESSDTLDAKIKSIITNALMGDEITEVIPSGGKKARTSSSGGNTKQQQQQQTSSDKIGGDKTVLGNPTSISVPVKLPLKDASSTSVPVSIPLHSEGGDSSLRTLLTSCGAKSSHKHHKQQQEPPTSSSSPQKGGSGRSHAGRSSNNVVLEQGESYSPISRPSSSSSTASAESVKHLEHGARVASVSPKSNLAAQVTPGARPGSAPTSSQSSVLAKGPLSVQTDSTQAKAGVGASVDPASAALSLYAGYPHIGAMLLQSGYGYNQPTAAEKEQYAKMLLLSNYPYGIQNTASQLGASMMYQYGQMNGMSKLGVPGASSLVLEESKGRGKPTKQRRSKALGSGGSGGGSVAADSSKKPAHSSSGSLSGGAFDRGGMRRGDEVALSRATPEVVSMMSTASQPLAISAISDAESTKSSPLDKSPTKPNQTMDKHKGIYTRAKAPPWVCVYNCCLLDSQIYISDFVFFVKPLTKNFPFLNNQIFFLCAHI